jgi:hypothetical protein
MMELLVAMMNVNTTLQPVGDTPIYPGLGILLETK